MKFKRKNSLFGIFAITMMGVVAASFAQKADVNAKDANGMTPLMNAAVAGDADRVKSLLSEGAVVNARTDIGMTALQLAAFYGKTDCVRALCDTGADVNSANANGNTALTFAAWKGHPDCISALLTAHANLNTANQFGQTALILAAMQGHADCLTPLVAAGANVDAQEDSYEWSALAEAAKLDHLDCVKILITAGANATLKDNDGKLAVDLASSFPDIVALLRGAKKNLSQSDTNLSGAAWESQLLKQGLQSRSFINISTNDLAQECDSTEGGKLQYSPSHAWEGPVTLRGFNMSGSDAYAIGTMVAQQTQGGQPTLALLPIGAGTILRVFGKVQLLDNTISAAGGEPLLFVVHNAAGTEEAKPNFTTSGPLHSLPFKITPTVSALRGAPTTNVVFLQLVHIGGIGDVLLKDGSRVALK